MDEGAASESIGNCLGFSDLEADFELLVVCGVFGFYLHSVADVELIEAIGV